MQIKLTKRQKGFLEEHKEKGKFHLNEVVLLYAISPSRKDFLHRLTLAGTIKDIGNGFFKIISNEPKNTE